MSKTTKRWLTAATILVVLGIVLFMVAMTMNHWDFKRLSTMEYETTTQEIREDFQNLRIDTEAATLYLAPSEDGKCSVVCHGPETERYTAAVEDGTLTVRREKKSKWYEHMGISFDWPTVTVYLPEQEYGALVVKASTGSIQVPAGFRFQSADIAADAGDVEWKAPVRERLHIEMDVGDVRVENVTADTLDIRSDTGEITVSSVTCANGVQVVTDVGAARLSDVTCGSLTAMGETGDILLERVTASGAMNIGNDVGDVRLDGCDAGELEIETETGSVTGTLLSEKVFLVESDTGEINVPKTVSGGRCEIRTDIGDIQIELA